MNITQTIKAVSTSYWAIDLNFAKQAAPALLSSLISPKNEDYYETEREDINSVFSITDRCATLKVAGPMLKNDGLCSYGTDTMCKMLSNYAANYDSIFLEIDSPGGEVDGTSQLAQTIRSLNKPTLAFVSAGMACSAAYWIASSANEIYASSETDRIGSIGTVISFADMQPYWESQGVKFHEIYASQSSEKNAAFKEALAGDYDKIRSEMLNPINDYFIASVKNNRPQASDEVFSGSTYTAAKALELGLIDKISSRAEAYAYLQSKNKKDKDYYTNENNMLSMTNLKQWLGFGDATQTEQGLEINSDGIATLEAKIDELKAQNEQLAAKNTQLENEKLSLQNELVNLKAQPAQVTQLQSSEPEQHETPKVKNEFKGGIEALHRSASSQLPDWIK